MKKPEIDKRHVVVNSQDVATRGLMTMAFGIFLVIVVAIGLMFFNNTAATKYHSEEQFIEMNDGWEVNISGNKKSFSIPDWIHLEPGDEVVLSRNLPESINEYSALVSRNYHMKMVVSIGGKEVYRYPEDKNSFISTILVDDWNVIDLNPEMSKKLVEIKFTPSRAGFDGVIRPIYVGAGESIIRHLRDKYSLFFVTGISILVSGVLILFLGIFYYKYDRDTTQPVVGIMLLITGVWLTNRSKMPVLGVGSAWTFLACFLALILVPLALGIYCATRFPNKNKTLTSWVVGLDILFIFVILLALSRGYTILELALPVYLMMALNVIYVEYNLWGYAFGKESMIRSKRDVLKDRIEWITNALMILGFIIETVSYTDELMTEINMINRVAFNIFASGHLAKLLIDSYNGIKDRNEAVAKLHDSQVSLLMGQIQPHFIFNTLSSIRTLIKVDPDTAYDMVYNFSNYLRANVDNMTNLSGISFDAELEHIRSYLSIEQVRFGDRVNVEYDIQANDFKVPPLSIQPLVENAVKHGLCKRPEGGNMWIRSYKTEHYYVVEVQDDGMGFSSESLNAVFGGEMEEQLGTDKMLDITTLEETIKASNLLDAKGKPIEISLETLASGGNLTGNGSEVHKSSGLRNIILRLKEMSNASVEIESQEGAGTLFRVLFPIER
ncbi:MAG: histidine kinase [Firmicutes bacterium]|nr:histidine kinase [Bacillota bacterium]